MIDPADPLLAAVIADPDSDEARLALARALRERGDAQGELMDLQTKAAHELRTYGATSEYRTMRLRASELEAKHAATWTSGVRHLATQPILLRGLVEGVTVEANRFLAIAPQLYELAPIRQVILVDTGDAIADIARSPLLDRLVSLSFYNRSRTAAIGDAGARALAGSAHVHRLKRLGLENNELTAAGIDAIAGSKMLNSLIYVGLGGNPAPSPVESYGTDPMTGSVASSSGWLDDAGRALEAKYGDLAWLHAPTRLLNYPPDDADL